jgi:hypothetical protein
VADASIAADVHQALNVKADVFSEVAFNCFFGGDDVPDARNFIFGQVADLGAEIHLGAVQNAVGFGPPNAKNVCEGDLYALCGGQVYTGDACHSCSLALTLFVLWVFLADDARDSFAQDNFAVFAHFFDGGPDFHLMYLRCKRRYLKR